MNEEELRRTYDECSKLFVTHRHKREVERRVELLLMEAVQTFSDASVFLFHVRVLRACALSDLGKFAAAADSLSEALENVRDSLPPDDTHVVNAKENLVNSLIRMRRFSDALALRKELFELSLQLYGFERPVTLEKAQTYGAILRVEGHFEEALELDRRILQARESLGQLIADRGPTAWNIAADLQGLGRLDEAASALVKAWRELTRLPPQNPLHRIIRKFERQVRHRTHSKMIDRESLKQFLSRRTLQEVETYGLINLPWGLARRNNGLKWKAGETTELMDP